MFCAWLYLLYLRVFFRPDVIHAHSVGPYALIAAMIPASTLITTAWGSDILVNGKNPFYRPLIRFILQRSQRITCDAHHMLEALEKLGASRLKCSLINFGIDTKRLVKLDRGAIPSPFGGSERDKKVVVSLRNHYPVYSNETLIEAAAMLSELRSDILFVLAGTGPSTEEYKSLIENGDLKKTFMFYGRYNGAELPEIFAHSDIYVSCSLSDAGIASSTAEAMSCEVPVVISATGENSLWVKDDRNGFLFDAGDAGALAAWIAKLADDSELRTRIGAAARETMIEQNDYTNEMEKVHELYRLECSRK
jgi:glycosyltransferase involved in cell wall biosynthesis